MIAFILGFAIGVCGVSAIQNLIKKDYPIVVFNVCFALFAYYLLTLL